MFYGQQTIGATHYIPQVLNEKDSVITDSVKGKKDKNSKKEDKKETDYDKLLKKGGSFQQGLFGVRHIEKDWYFEIPESVLGRLLMSVTRFATVPEGFSKLTGEEVQTNTIYFEQHDEKTLLLRSFVRSTYSKKGDHIASLVDKATVNPIIDKFDIIGRNPKTKDMLIKVTSLFATDNKIGGFTSSDRNIIQLGALKPELTFIDTMRVYPINIEVSTLRTYTVSSGRMPSAATGFSTLSLNTSIVELPEKPMQARWADERVGYFTNSITEFSDDDPSIKEAIISRYRLVPKNKKAYAAGKLVEPEKQIVYYIDPATPKKWVPYLIQGINDWNVAFEAAGFKNAIIGKEWPNDPTMSVDDARYCVLRYLPSESENAYGPRIVDPRSGEIIESHICWYHNVMNLIRKWYITQCGPLDKRAQKWDIDDELMGQLIRFVSSHEVGHTLGLRHNMIASSATPVEKLRDKAWVEKYGHTSSIMDYARFNYVAQPEDNISPRGLFPRINDYDKWAIKWGYQYRPEFKTPADEQKVLRTEVTRMLKDNIRLRYCGDEGKGQDPRSQTEDLGDNAMKAGDYGIKNLKRVMQNIEKWTEQPDDQTDNLMDLHKSVRAQFTRYATHVQRYLNGQYTNNTPGDVRHATVPKALQQEAIDWMSRNVFDAPLWLYPDRLVSKLGIDAEDELNNRCTTVLAYLLSPGMLYNQEKNGLTATSPYPVDEYLNDVFKAAWKPMSATDSRRNTYRRQLERSYLNFLNTIINPTEKQLTGLAINAQRSDAVIYALQHLSTIEAFCKQQRSKQQGNDINALHYDNILLQLNKIREEYNKVK
ncbi:MAG: zinc-dependent metalloprotease [Prevotella sp.]|nr:zinc-dependent metalloprotease [Prevotella sp.]